MNATPLTVIIVVHEPLAGERAPRRHPVRPRIAPRLAPRRLHVSQPLHAALGRIGVQKVGRHGGRALGPAARAVLLAERALDVPHVRARGVGRGLGRAEGGVERGELGATAGGDVVVEGDVGLGDDAAAGGGALAVLWREGKKRRGCS